MPLTLCKPAICPFSGFAPRNRRNMDKQAVTHVRYSQCKEKLRRLIIVFSLNMRRIFNIFTAIRFILNGKIYLSI
jgi:hypothetical protein